MRHSRMVRKWFTWMSDGSDIRRDLTGVGTVVIKVGSALLSDPEQGLATSLVGSLGEEIVRLLEGGRRVLLVDQHTSSPAFVYAGRGWFPLPVGWQFQVKPKGNVH